MAHTLCDSLNFGVDHVISKHCVVHHRTVLGLSRKERIEDFSPQANFFQLFEEALVAKDQYFGLRLKLLLEILGGQLGCVVHDAFRQLWLDRGEVLW